MQDKLLPYYELLAELFIRVHATGRYARTGNYKSIADQEAITPTLSEKMDENNIDLMLRTPSGESSLASIERG